MATNLAEISTSKVTPLLLALTNGAFGSLGVTLRMFLCGFGFGLMEVVVVFRGVGRLNVAESICSSSFS